MREWIIALGLLVLVAVLLDGLRRMRNARRDSLQMSLNMNSGVDRDSLDAYGNEFPSGGARVRYRGDDQEPVFSDDDETLPLADTVRRKVSDLGLHQSVPMLMDVKEELADEAGFDEEDDLPEDLLEELCTDVEGDDLSTAHIHGHRPTADFAPAVGDGILGKPRVYERPADREPPRREAPVIKESRPVIQVQQERAAQEQEQRRRLEEERREAELQQQKESQRKQQASAREPEVPRQLSFQEVIVVSVMAREPGGFCGSELLDVLLNAGMRYGHHNIFHHYIGEDREDDSLYSLVNIVKPGTFDLNAMETFTTPGVSLFLELPAPAKSMDAFDSMLATARAIADTLNGELRDENRSVMTGQTIEHCRQRIRDFEMQSRLRVR